MEFTIIGAGIAGLSCSYHLGHERCCIIEQKPYVGGHAATHMRNGAFWDEGPHVSFTKSSYVQKLLGWSSESVVLNFPTEVGNWFNGHWIPHPAQCNLHAVPQPLAKSCLDDFLNSRSSNNTLPPTNYQEWLDKAFGHTFARTFPEAYTRKYWTCDPSSLSTDWIGDRVFYPSIETVVAGYNGNPKGDTHYISSVRYPSRGGFQAFLKGMAKGARVQPDRVTAIDLKLKKLTFLSGIKQDYNTLINTIPLDQLIGLISNVPQEVKDAAYRLKCSSLLLVNILGTNMKRNRFHWLYIYDENMYSTRITQTHLLSPQNTPDEQVGIQVEVYASSYRPFPADHDSIAQKVVEEVLEMQLVDQVLSVHTNFVQYANIIFDHQRRAAQDLILSFLCQYGLQREPNDLDPLTDWSICEQLDQLPELVLAGRFGQWKYSWSDDCVLRGKQIASWANEQG
jgi:protoporphyrinogen oxidase